jgi:ELWxxDGT repeat protein
MVEDINDDGGDFNPSGFTALGDWLYFMADDGTHGLELWRTNGTTTQLVENINTANGGVNDSNPYGFTAFNGYLYFNAYESTHGAEIWRTNGTTTALVEDISTGNSGADSSNPNYLTVLGDWLYFVATDGTHGYELWRINDEGTTQSVAVPGTSAGVTCMCARPLSAMDGRLFIAMYSDETGSEFAYLDEPTFGLPGTNRDGSAWSTALVLLAAITAAAGLTVCMRGAPRS